MSYEPQYFMNQTHYNNYQSNLSYAQAYGGQYPYHSPWASETTNPSSWTIPDQGSPSPPSPLNSSASSGGLAVNDYNPISEIAPPAQRTSYPWMANCRQFSNHPVKEEQVSDSEVVSRNPNGKTRTKDKYRVVYSEPQRQHLEKEFRQSKYITIKRKTDLARKLDLTERQIKIWFQNRRAKERKQNKKMGIFPDEEIKMEPQMNVAYVTPGTSNSSAHFQHQNLTAYGNSISKHQSSAPGLYPSYYDNNGPYLEAHHRHSLYQHQHSPPMHLGSSEAKVHVDSVQMTVENNLSNLSVQ